MATTASNVSVTRGDVPQGLSMARVAVVGVHGHGRVHLANVKKSQDEGLCRLVAVADPVHPGLGVLDSSVRVFTDLAALLESETLDVVGLCTRHLHTEQAEAAMRAGADVLLEKPPVPTIAQFRRLLEVSAEAGRSCQVGFQSLGSAAVARLSTAIAAGALGEVTKSRRGAPGFGVAVWDWHRDERDRPDDASQLRVVL